MSKSEGDTLNPIVLTEQLGSDRLRYLLSRSMRFGEDASYNPVQIAALLNEDLADRYGNLLSRATSLAVMHFGGMLPDVSLKHPSSLVLKERSIRTVEEVFRHVEQLEPDLALQRVSTLLAETNRYISVMAPWKSAKVAGTKDEAAESLWVCSEVLRIASGLLLPAIPSKAIEALVSLGFPEAKDELADADSFFAWGGTPRFKAITKAPPLFTKLG